ncbi:MAG: hypothetical protein E7516_02660 [Ruminococcaceae bacterium]|nr:hypothetical protein [Oscillospiraceae bacterium]
MGISDMIICVLFVMLASSYGWGMRGTVIGGEKGAMLPGAFIGLILARFAGGGIYENFWTVAAAGLMGMTYGGSETYGETIGFVLHRDAGRGYRPVKGYSGLFLKGALWFSICGGFIAFAISSMAGNKYSLADIMIFCLLIPVFQLVGYYIFNTPYNKEKGIHPKCYYSRTRREEWGGNLVTLLALIALGIIRNDSLMLSMIWGGFLGGGLGWLAAMKFYEATVFPVSNGKYIFDRFFRNGIYDGWKTMEFTLGAIGGAGVAIGFCRKISAVEEINGMIASSGLNTLPPSAEKFMPLAVGLLAAGIIAVNAYGLYCDKKEKNCNTLLCDRIERTLYNVIPMALVLTGSAYAARLMTVFMLVLVLGIKCVFERFSESRLMPLYGAIALPVCGGVFAGDIILGGYGPFALIFAGTVPYLLAELLHAMSKKRRAGRSIKDGLCKTAFATVYPCFLIMCTIIYIASAKIFGF